MVVLKHEITIDLNAPDWSSRLYLVQGTDNEITMHIQKSGAPYDLTGIGTAVLVSQPSRRGSMPVTSTATITDAKNGVAVVKVLRRVFEYPGIVKSQLKLYGEENGGQLSSTGFEIEVEKSTDKDYQPADDELSFIEQNMADVTAVTVAASDAADAANTSRTQLTGAVGGALSTLNQQKEEALGELSKVTAANETHYRGVFKTVAERDAAITNPIHGDTVTVADETAGLSTTYRYVDATVDDTVSESAWVVTDHTNNPLAINQISQQLADTVSKITDAKSVYRRELNEIKKANSVLTSSEEYTSFQQNGSPRIYKTTGVIVDAEGNITLDTTASATAEHTNVALINAFQNNSTKSIELEITEKPTTATVFRIAFGVDEKNFIFYNIFTGETYIIENGTLSQTLKKQSTSFKITDINVGDRIRVNYYNDNLQVYFNNVLRDIVATGSEVQRAFGPNSKVLGGVSWKNYATNFKARNIRLQPDNHKNKIMHISFDDVFVSLSLLTTRTYYTSIFDLPMFAFLRDMHEKYGAVFSLYCYYERAGSLLSGITNKFKSEFKANSNWLKFGFHSYNNVTSLNGTVTDADAKTQYDNFVREIIRIASAENIDRVPRLHYYDGNLSAMRAIRDTYKGILGALTEDSTDSSYYLSTAQNNATQKFDEVIDYQENLYFYKTDMRLESHSDPVATLSARSNDIAYLSQNDLLVVFTHEDFLTSNDSATVETMKGKIEAVCKYGFENDYIFDYPQRYLVR